MAQQRHHQRIFWFHLLVIILFVSIVYGSPFSENGKRDNDKYINNNNPSTFLVSNETRLFEYTQNKYLCEQQTRLIKNNHRYDGRQDNFSRVECERVRHYDGDQCAYVQMYCSKPLSGLINYMYFYYCTLRNMKWLAISIMIVFLFYLFLVFGTTASEYFCPNLSNISAFLRLSQSVAGVTIAALGNGAPDIFTTFSSFRSEISGLALGELIGAGLFTTSIIVAVIAFMTPIKLPRRPFIRDTIFFIGAVAFLTGVIWDGFVTLAEGIGMIAYYIAYVITVVVGNKIYRSNSISPIPITVGVSIPEEEEEIFPDTPPSPSSPLPPSSPPPLSPSSPSSLSLPPFSKSPNGIGRQSPLKEILSPKPKSAVSVQALTGNIHMPSSQPSLLPDFESDSDFEIEYDAESQRLLPSRIVTTELLQDESDSFIVSLEAQELARSNRFLRPLINEISPKGSVSRHSQDRSVDGEESLTFLRRQGHTPSLLPPSSPTLMESAFPVIGGWENSSNIIKVKLLLSLPFVFVLRITVPVVMNEEAKLIVYEDRLAESTGSFVDEDCVVEEGRMGVKWNRWLFALQMMLSPILIVFTLSDNNSVHLMTPILSISIALLSIIFMRPPTRPPRIIMSTMGFFVSITWIYLIANEVVGLLAMLGHIAGLSVGVLGLTVFAAGNSIGDVFTNITLAKMGLPAMAVGACFGGPMLNIVLGIGITATYITLKSGSPHPLRTTLILKTSCITLLVSLCIGMMVVIWKRFKISKIYGFVMCFVWMMAMIITLYIGREDMMD